MNPFFAPALGVGAIMSYLMWSRSREVDSGLTNPEAGTTAQVLRQYADLDDFWSNPLNLTSNVAYTPVIKTEPGQFGIPRNYVRGPGDSVMITQGNYLTSL